MNTRRYLALVPLLALTTATAHAQTVNWIGSAGGFWDIGANWSPAGVPNAATIDIVNATGNKFVHRTGTTLVNTVQTNAELELTGGVLELLSTLTFNAGGSLRVAGGTLKGATINNTSLLSFTTHSTNTFDNVTLGAGQGLNIGNSTESGYLRIKNGLNYSGTPTFNLGSGGNYGRIEFDMSGLPGQSYTFDNANVNLGTSGSSYIAFGTSNTPLGSALTLGSSLNIQGKGGFIGGPVQLGGGTRTLTVNASLISDEGGTWNIGDTLTAVNLNANVTATTTASSTFNLSGTTLTVGAGRTVEHAVAGQLSSVTATALNNAGTFQSSAPGGVLAIGFSGASNLNNTGTIQALGGGKVTIANPTTLTSLGTVLASGSGSLVELNANLSALAPWSGVSVASGGVVRYGGVFTNPGTFTIASVTGAANANGFLELSGTISGGTLADASLLRFNSSTPAILSGVTLGAGQGLTVLPALGSGALVRVQNGLTYSGTPTFTLGDATRTGQLQFDTNGLPGSSYTFDNASVTLGNVNSRFSFGTSAAGTPASTLTLGSGLNVQGKGGLIGESFLGSGARTLNISANLVSDEGDTWNIGGSNVDVNNNATIRAASVASSRFAVSAQSLTNGAGATIENTLSGPSTIAANVVNNAGTIQSTASGASLAVTLNGTVGTQSLNNTGTIRASNGGTVNVSAASGVNLTNAGAINIGTGSTVTVGNPLTNAAGGTIVDDGTLSMTTSNLTLSAGTLSGAGQVTFTGAGKLVNSGGIVSPGNSPGTLSVSGGGGYQQSGTGSLFLELAGTGAGQFDVLSVTGAAALGGTLDLQQIAGFTAAAGQSFDILTASGGITGSFTTINPGNINPGIQPVFSLVSGGTVGRLSFQVAVPEPGSLTLLGLGGIFLIGLRRRVNRASAGSS